jgi:hypothetical protein
MIRTIRLTATDMHKADALLPIDDEGCRSSDIEAGNPQAMVDTIALDDSTVGVDEERQCEAMRSPILCHLRGALADDDQHLDAARLIRCEVSLQLLQLRSAGRSPCAPNEHDHRRFGA